MHLSTENQIHRIMFSYIVFATILGCVYSEVISIDQGLLNGTILHSRNGNPFHAFYSIPYAAPPVGDLRFLAPKKPYSWNGTRDATKKGPVCPQPTSFATTNVTFTGQEDCLYLSVFTPQINPDKKLPVVVYIHGGALTVGYGDAKGAQFFMDKQVVMVTMNYRQGIFGFLSAGDTVIPGNYGLKDQTAALYWIKQNIAAFGGDSNAVTILGQSSGATCVHFHTLSPRSKGLFHRAIMQSGSALSYWSHYNQKYTKLSFRETIKRINCVRNKTKEVLSCLRQLSMEQLLQTEHSFLAEKRIVIKYRPAIEKARVKGAFLTSSPYKLSYQNTSIPWLIGFNSAEGIIEVAIFLKKYERKNNKNLPLNKMLPLSLHYKYNTRKEFVTNMTSLLKKNYFENGVFSENDDKKLCDLVGDFVFAMPILQSVNTYPGPKHLYYYDYQNDISSRSIFLNYTKYLGSGHGDEMSMLFQTKCSEQLIEADKKLSEILINYWTNFITKGDPNGIDLPQWDPVTGENFEYLHINNDKLSIKTNLLQDRFKFWRSLPLESNMLTHS